jgi:hypothetical protein
MKEIESLKDKEEKKIHKILNLASSCKSFEQLIK